MSLQVRGREPARPHYVPSYEDKALCQSQRFELDIRKDWQGREGYWLGVRVRLGVCWRLREGQGTLAGVWRLWRACRAWRRRPALGPGGRARGMGRGGQAQPPRPASPPFRDSALQQRLITTCQYRFLSSLTCLHIFPNKERSCKHGNHFWQRQTAARGQQGPEPGPAQEGDPRGRRDPAVAALQTTLNAHGGPLSAGIVGGVHGHP